MARGEQEQKCIDFVRKQLEENKFNSLLPNKDIDIIRQIFHIAKPNSHLSEFPDFIFENGFIEHFQVTSAKETKKGSKSAEASASFEKECESANEEMLKTLMQSHEVNQFYTHQMEMDCPECSYEYYEKSFKKNFEHHIESLERYTGAKNVGIFLIEQSGSPITILKDNKFVDFYHLQMDALLLDYLYQYKDKLKYVVFYHQTFCDIISLKDISTIKSKIPDDITWGMGRFRNMHVVNAIDIEPSKSPSEVNLTISFQQTKSAGDYL